MKNRRLIPLFVSATLFSALGFSAVSPVSAQPAAAKAGRKGKGVKRGGLPKRMMEKLEEKMGKPLTDDQKERLATAHKARLAANKAAQDKFNIEGAAITGLSVEDMKALNKRGPAKAANAAR